MIRSLLITIAISGASFAQYAPIELPQEWTFKIPTPAYAIDAPDQEMGTFQPGIKVSIEGTHPDSGKWRVAFKRYGQPSIQSLIDPPNLAETHTTAFEQIAPIIAEFPLLRKLLEQPASWPDTATDQAKWLFPDKDSIALASGSEESPTKLVAQDAAEDARAWGVSPLTAFIDYQHPENPSVTIEFWNKGDAFKSNLEPSSAYRKIQEKFERIQDVFPTYRDDPGSSSAANSITAVRTKETVYLLPNDLRVSLRYDHGEYLLLTFQSISKLETSRPTEYEPDRFKEQIASKVAQSRDGHTYVGDIPMIDQGDKGYCAAATLARVLQFYGYQVDQHAMADLAETEAQLTQNDSGGTLRKNMIKAMGRICGSTPFRLREITKERPEEIMPVIEQGIPIIWFIPGHARLLIGLHPENNQIVYSDSWGLEHAYKTAPWDYFVNVNQEMWILVPR